MIISDRMIKARAKLLLEKPFFGTLALYLDMKEDGRIPTMATDGKYIYYNKDFAKNLSDKDIQFIICHEIMHVVLKHGIRRYNKEPMRWNYAVDYAVNSLLKEEYYSIPKGCLYNPKYKEKSAEEIYNLLPKDLSKSNNNGKSKNGGSDGEEQKGLTGDFGQDSFDTHMDMDEGMTAQDIKDMEEEWKMRISKAVQTAKQRGNFAGCLDRITKDLFALKLDWKNILRQFLVTKAKNDYTWMIPNRRLIHQGLYFPSMTSESLGTIAVIVDNSGSIGDDDLKRFLSEINGIRQAYDMDLHLIGVDTEVNSYKQYSRYDTLSLKMSGGGGTDIKEALNFMKEKNIKPDAVIFFTDGETDLNFKVKYPSLWIITKDGIDLDKIKEGLKVKL